MGNSIWKKSETSHNYAMNDEDTIKAESEDLEEHVNSFVSWPGCYSGHAHLIEENYKVVTEITGSSLVYCCSSFF